MANNVIEYLKVLEQERYRAVLIHVVPDKSPALTTFCKKICNQVNGKYIDLLDMFIQSRELSESVDVFSPDRFKSLLIEQSRMQSLLIVDRIDFLVDTWRKAEKQVFYRFVKNQWDGYKDGMQARLLMCMQTPQDIESQTIIDSQGKSRIFHLADFNDII